MRKILLIFKDEKNGTSSEIILPIKRYQNEYETDSLSDDLDDTHSVENEPQKYLKLFDDKIPSLNYKFS